MSFDENMYTVWGLINLTVGVLSHGVGKCSALVDTDKQFPNAYQFTLAVAVSESSS